MNAHSSRKLYARALRSSGAKWEKEVGALPATDCSPETAWRILRQADGTYVLQNAASQRKLFAKTAAKGEKWNSGVGAAPGDHTG